MSELYSFPHFKGTRFFTHFLNKKTLYLDPILTGTNGFIFCLCSRVYVDIILLGVLHKYSFTIICIASKFTTIYKHTSVRVRKLELLY